MLPPDQQQIIGIVGGMGPMSGVLLQKLIIDFTPADIDQEHLPVITFTNPSIPDRTKSLFSENNGDDFAVAIQNTANILVRAGATVIGIPCNTSHAKYSEIQSGVIVPIINMVTATVDYFEKLKIKKVGILATDGTIMSGVYSKASENIEWVIPNKEDQKNVMKIIYQTKAGLPVDKNLLLGVCKNLMIQGADLLLLGCTEISLFYETISPRFPTVDSLRILAQSLVNHVSTAPKCASSNVDIHEQDTIKCH